MSYTSLPTQKSHPYSNINSKLYKPAFYSGHLPRNTFYSGTTTLQVFHLPQ